METHTAKIVSLHDAQIKCSCSWRMTTTGHMTKAQLMAEHTKHRYYDFKHDWQKTHSISPAPSFTNWKRSYQK